MRLIDINTVNIRYRQTKTFCSWLFFFVPPTPYPLRSRFLFFPYYTFAPVTETRNRLRGHFILYASNF